MWTDIGGFSRNLHVVTSSSHGEYIYLLCGTRITYAFHVDRKFPIPCCRNCLNVLRKQREEVRAAVVMATRMEIHRFARVR